MANMSQYAVIEEIETPQVYFTDLRQHVIGVYSDLYTAIEKVKEVHPSSDNRVYVQEIAEDRPARELKHIYVADGVYQYTVYLYVEEEEEELEQSFGYETKDGWLIPDNNEILMEPDKKEDSNSEDGVDTDSKKEEVIENLVNEGVILPSTFSIENTQPHDNDSWLIKAESPRIVVSSENESSLKTIWDTWRPLEEYPSMILHEPSEIFTESPERKWYNDSVEKDKEMFEKTLESVGNSQKTKNKFQGMIDNFLFRGD